MKAVVVVPILGSGNAWGVAGPTDPPERVRDRAVTLQIEGDGVSGYHLVMSPAGCFTADTWHESIADAKAAAAEVFGVTANAWVGDA